MTFILRVRLWLLLADYQVDTCKDQQYSPGVIRMKLFP